MTNFDLIPQAVAIARPFVLRFEGRVLTPYQDSGGVWTIGVGFTSLPDGLRVGPNTPQLTDAQCDQILDWWLDRIANAIAGVVTVGLNPNQFAALIDFCFNLGDGALDESTLLKLLDRGDYQGAAPQFPRWDEVDGVPNEEIKERREAEEQLFLTPWNG